MNETAMPGAEELIVNEDADSKNQERHQLNKGVDPVLLGGVTENQPTLLGRMSVSARTFAHEVR